NPSAAASTIEAAPLKTPDAGGNQEPLFSPPHVLFVTKGPLASFAAAQNLGMAGRSHGLDHLEDALAHPGFADLVVGAHQFEGLALDQRVLFLLERRASFAEALAPTTRHRPAGQRVGRHLVEEIGYRDVLYLGKLQQPPRTDSVGAALIFLDLLKGEPDGRSQLLLAHAEKGTALAHTRTDMDVHRM